MKRVAGSHWFPSKDMYKSLLVVRVKGWRDGSELCHRALVLGRSFYLLAWARGLPAPQHQSKKKKKTSMYSCHPGDLEDNQGNWVTVSLSPGLQLRRVQLKVQKRKLTGRSVVGNLPSSVGGCRVRSLVRELGSQVPTSQLSPSRQLRARAQHSLQAAK